MSIFGLNLRTDWYGDSLSDSSDDESSEDIFEHEYYSHHIAKDFKDAIEIDDLEKFKTLSNFTSNRKNVLEEILRQFFEIKTLVQEICSFFEFPALQDLKFSLFDMYEIDDDKNFYSIWDSLFYGHEMILSNCISCSSFDKPKIEARKIFMYIMQNLELEIKPKSESGLKYFFESSTRKQLENTNILAQILHSSNLTYNDFRYGLIKMMRFNNHHSEEQVELFLNHKFLTKIQFKQGNSVYLLK
jgi:hypothetical protein